MVVSGRQWSCDFFHVILFLNLIINNNIKFKKKIKKIKKNKKK